jgi:hypothetical protein
MKLAPQNPKSSAAFSHVCKIEHPLGAAQCLANALALITETLDEPAASAMNEIVHMVRAHLREIDKEYSYLFHFHHPNREQFERDGWPTEKLDGKPETD